MISFHIMQLLNNLGLFTLGTDIWYGEHPYDDSQNGGMEGIVIAERGGGFRDGCLAVSEFIDFYARYCSASDTHKAIQKISDALHLYRCDDLPDVTYQCCQDPDFFNEYSYENVKFTIDSNYESLGKDAQGKWLARLGFEVRYVIKTN